MSIQRTPLTIIPVLYRDASNYKVYREMAFDGAITDEQKFLLTNALSEDLYFIPAQIGLEHLGSHLGNDVFPGEDDHPWHEMYVPDITVVTECDEDNTIRTGQTITEFVEAVTAAYIDGWDDTAPVEG